MKRALILFLILVPFVCHATEQNVWVTADGESIQGEMDTLKEVKDRAKRDAQTKAIEMAIGTFVKSHTLVSNSQVADDLIYAAVRGKITKEEIISSGWNENDRNVYRMKIRALVEPCLPGEGRRARRKGLSVQVGPEGRRSG